MGTSRQNPGLRESYTVLDSRQLHPEHGQTRSHSHECVDARVPKAGPPHPHEGHCTRPACLWCLAGPTATVPFISSNNCPSPAV